MLTLRGIGEMKGDKKAKPGDQNKSWIDLTFNDPNQVDGRGMRRAWVNLETTDSDNAAWEDMEKEALELARKVAGDAAKIQYWDGGNWNKNPPQLPLNTNTGRDLIGSTHHEAGTLWMGAPTDSVTDSNGKFHHIDNAYVAGPALFPVYGSANPSLTGMTLARKTAGAIVASYIPAPSNTFKSLFTGSPRGWQMAGAGRFLNLFGSILEAQGGPGILWYTREVFRNFVLKVDWLSFNPTGSNADNSGIFIRFPVLNAGDPAKDWKLAVNWGYEIQIDDTGFNPDTNTNGSPLHQTGAVYGFGASSQIASNAAGVWNTYEIEATKDKIRVTLNNTLVTDFQVDGSRTPVGHIGLQNHTGKVQFRNIQICSLTD